MTDLPVSQDNLPGRLGATARIVGDELVIDLHPQPALLRGPMVRTSVVSYIVDCVAGVPLQHPDAWTLTSDMTVRCAPIPAPERMSATFRLLRRGHRTATGHVTVVDDSGRVVGDGAIGFTRVTRKEGDPPFPVFVAEEFVKVFGSLPPLTEPLRECAGIEVVDGAAGIVEVPLHDRLRNPAGTLQGAMTALIAEVAAEEAFSTRAGEPYVVTDLDVRYLSRTGAGPVRTSTLLVGDATHAAATVEIVDTSTGAVAAIVNTRGVALTSVRALP